MGDISTLGMMAAGQALGGVMGIGANARQIEQQRRLQRLQMDGAKEMTEWQMRKQLEMWEKTGYGAQMKQMEKAGLNPALMYGMSGGGGQTAGVSPGSVGGAQAASDGNMGMMFQGTQQAMQLALLKAQKENIEADTENKQAGTTGQSLENTLNEYLLNADEEGTNVEGDLKSGIAGKMAIQGLKKLTIETVFTGDENARQKAMNSAKLAEIAQEIDLMKKKGNSEVEILENLKKSGKLMQMEINWNEIGLTKDTLKQVLLGLLKGLVK